MSLRSPVTAAAGDHWAPPSLSTGACWRRSCISRGTRHCQLKVLKRLNERFKLDLGFCIFQAATDPAPASGPGPSARTSTESFALPDPASPPLSSIYLIFFLFHVRQLFHPTCSANSCSSAAQPLATSPGQLLLLLLLLWLLLILFILFFFSVPCGLRCLPSGSSPAHQPAVTPSSPYWHQTAAPLCRTLHLSFRRSQGDRVEPESGPQHRLRHARLGSVHPAAAEQLRDGEVERPDLKEI